MRVAVCTPIYRDANWRFVRSLSNLLIYSIARRIEPLSCVNSGHWLGEQREALAQAAMDAGAEYLLWLDADQEFPPDTMLRLLDRGADIVGANYPMRGNTPEKVIPTAARMVDGKPVPVPTTREQAEANTIEEVDALGFGVILIARKVFAKLDRPWFEPHGEDYRFCVKARQAGFKVWCDHGLSGEIGHVHEQVLTIADMAADRALYQMKHRPKG